MATDRRLAFTPNFVVGISIMLLGIVLTLDRLEVAGIAALWRWWPLLVILFGASLVAQAWRGNAEPGTPVRQERPIISPGFVLVLVVAYLFVTHAQRRHELTTVDAGADTVSVFVIMGADGHTSRATRFRGGDMTTVVGRARLDLREAHVAPGEEAVLDILTVLGRLEIIVPEGWTVDVEAPRVMGRVRDERWRRARGRTARGKAAGRARASRV